MNILKYTIKAIYNIASKETGSVVGNTNLGFGALLALIIISFSIKDSVQEILDFFLVILGKPSSGIDSVTLLWIIFFIVAFFYLSVLTVQLLEKK